jgi:hypothetical protein
MRGEQQRCFPDMVRNASHSEHVEAHAVAFSTERVCADTSDSNRRM